jgi:hypothetical protein
MKKIILFLCVLCAFVVNVQAQVPNQFNYQAVARNNAGQSIANANIRTKFTILDGSATGTNVYSEVRSLTTNQLGLFTAAIGGTGATSVTGNFATIDWSTGKKFIKVEVDPLGGTNFLAIGNTEMLSVPYALYAVNGKVGPQGFKSLLKTTPEIAGGNCSTGGQKIESGIDVNNNNILDAAEISSTQFVCNGIQGFKTLLKTTTETAGANCATGGQKIESGVDVNNNNVLDPTEVTSVAYTCNGAQGPQGFKSLVKTTAEAAGANCTAGGSKIESGVDLNNNNILDPAEITNTAYTCNGDVTNAWKTTGNAATTASNFIGTTDVKPVIVKTNNTEVLRIDANGNVGIGTNAPSSKLAVISSSTQPLVNVNNTGSGPVSYGLIAASQNSVGVFGQSQSGRAVVGFNSSITEPTAELTNASSGPGIKVATSSLNNPSAQFINNNIYGTALELQGGMYAPSSLAGFNLVPLGVVTYDASFTSASSTDFPSSFINKAGDLVLSSIGHYESQSLGAPDYVYCDLFLDLAKTLPYTEIIAISTPNFNGEGIGLGGNGLITRIQSVILPAASPGNPQKKLRVEIGVDDFGNAGPSPLETARFWGTVIFYGLK